MNIQADLTQAFLKDLEYLVNTDSYSYSPEGVKKIAAFFEERFTELGWICEYVSVGEKVGPVLKIVNRPAARYDVTFAGHMDTVFPEGTCAERPFRIEGDRAYGPGVCDMKQGDLAMYYIAKSLDAETLEKLNICMLYTPDEEISSRFTREYLKGIAAQSDKVLIMEACLLDGSYCFSRKGKFSYKFAFRGIAAHAGFMLEVENASAVHEMAHWICELMALKDKEKGTTVNVAPVSGGIGCNTVPDYAAMDCEMRFYSNEEGQRIRDKIAELMAKPLVDGVRAEILEEHSTPAWRATAETWKYIDEVREIAHSIGQEFNGGWRGGLSDANNMAAHCPVIIDGMGPRGQYGHSEKETLDISGIEDNVMLCCAMLEALAK